MSLADPESGFTWLQYFSAISIFTTVHLSLAISLSEFGQSLTAVENNFYKKM